MRNTHKMHIVHIIGTLEGGGIQNLVLGLAKSAPLSSCQNSAISLLGVRGDLVNVYRSAGITLHTCRVQWPSRVRLIPLFIQNWIRKLAELTFPWRLGLILKMLKADIVHTHLPRSIDLVAHSVLRVCGFPLVWSIHAENLYFHDERAAGLKKAVHMLIHSGRGYITADSIFLADGLVHHIPEAEKVLRVVHAGADVRRFQVNYPRDPIWRKEHGIPERTILYGSCGRLAHVKGFDNFIQAASLLVKRGVDAHFAISGKGEMFGQLSNLIEKMGLSERFHLLGFQENLPFIHKQFDVFVMPSRSEGFPLALIEALTSGLPCIASDVSGVREMFGETGGLVVPTESPFALMEAMLQMYDRETREKYSKGAPARGLRYSFDNCASEFLNIYTMSVNA